jgi:hypothetical protein
LAKKTSGQVACSDCGNPLSETKLKPALRFGLLKGQLKTAKDFDAPLAAEILDEFEQ